LAGVVLSAGNTTQTIPIVTIDVDVAWTWLRLSDVVNGINSGTLATATLLVPDAPTIKLARQSNIITIIAQPITGQNINLGYNGIIVGSELFSGPIPSYTLTADGELDFSFPVANGTTITYQRQVWPYSLIGGDISLISLLDPVMPQMAQGPNGTMVYQVREVVQTIINKDPSYWSK